MRRGIGPPLALPLILSVCRRNRPPCRVCSARLPETVHQLEHQQKRTQAIAATVGRHCFAVQQHQQQQHQ